MRGKSIALLMLALGCGLVAAIGITRVLAKRNAAPAVQGETERIYVALKKVGMGEILSAEDLKLEPWPKDKVPSGALTKREEVEGRRTRTEIWPGEVILDNRLFAPGDDSQGTDRLIPKDYRVVAVKVDEVSSVGKMLRPGTRVDVMVHFTANPGKGIPNTVTKVVLQDIKVFAVDNNVNVDPETATATKTVSLLVRPEQAAKVMLASEMGKVRLIMRSPEDDQQDGGAEASPDALFGGGGADGAKRKNETLLPGGVQLPPPTQQANAGQSFLDVLQNAAGKALPGGANLIPDIEVNTHHIRVIRGEQVEDVTLRQDADQADSSGGAPQWSIGSALMGALGDKLPHPFAQQPEDAPHEQATEEPDGADDAPAPTQPEKEKE